MQISNSEYILTFLSQDKKKEKTLCDISIYYEGEEFHLHRCVLAAMSGYFYESLSKTTNEFTLTLPDSGKIDSSVFSLVLDFLYESDIKLGDQNIYDILYLAIYLKIPLLKDKCVTYLKSKINDETCLNMFFACSNLRYGDLMQACCIYMSENFQRLVTTSGYKQLSANNVKRVLWLVFEKQIEGNELEKYDLIKKWLMVDMNGRYIDGDKLLSLVNFEIIDQSRLRKIFDEDIVLKKCRCTRKKLYRILSKNSSKKGK